MIEIHIYSDTREGQNAGTQRREGMMERERTNKRRTKIEEVGGERSRGKQVANLCNTEFACRCNERTLVKSTPSAGHD